jgi:membrane protease subunit HflC
MRAWTLLILIVLVGGAVKLCAFQVEETEFAIVTRFGNPHREISRAGLGLKLPVDAVVKVDRRMHVLDPPASEVLTSDKKNILVNCFLTWSIEDPLRYVMSLPGRVAAEARLADILKSEMGAELASHPLTALVSVGDAASPTMDEILGEVTLRADGRARESFGIRVSSVRIKRLGFPPQNKQAVFRRMEAERQRIARLHRSEGEEEAEKIRARANREQAELINEANRESQEIRGAGEAEAIRILNEAHGLDPELYGFLRSLEALEKTVNDTSTLVIPSDWKLLDILKTPHLEGEAKSDKGGADR